MNLFYLFILFLNCSCKNAVPLFRSLKKKKSVAGVSLQVHKNSAKFRQTPFILASSWFSCAFSLQNKPIHRGDGVLKLKQVSFIRNNITTQMYFLADPVWLGHGLRWILQKVQLPKTASSKIVFLHIDPSCKTEGIYTLLVYSSFHYQWNYLHLLDCSRC